MVREQTRMSEMISRIQLDLETYKETQNDRLDDMLSNIDVDMKRVFHEVKRVENVIDSRVSQWKASCDGNFGRLTSDVELFKPKGNHISETSEGANNKDSSNKNVAFEIDILRNEWKTFRDEFEEEFCKEKWAIDPVKLAEHVENSTISKIENYISNEVVEEIIKSIDNNLSCVRAEFHHELELQKIRIEDTKAVVDVLKEKVNDIQSGKKCFNESDIFASSVDLTRTPMSSVRQGYFKSPMSARVASPILEDVNEEHFYDEGENKLEREDILDNAEETADHDITLYEDIGSNEKCSLSVNRDNVENNNVIMKDASVEIEVAETLSQEFQVVGEEFSKENYLSAKKEDFQVYSEFQASGTKCRRRESLMSNIFINLTSILDV